MAEPFFFGRRREYVAGGRRKPFSSKGFSASPRGGPPLHLPKTFFCGAGAGLHRACGPLKPSGSAAGPADRWSLTEKGRLVQPEVPPKKLGVRGSVAPPAGSGAAPRVVFFFPSLACAGMAPGGAFFLPSPAGRPATGKADLRTGLAFSFTGGRHRRRAGVFLWHVCAGRGGWFSGCWGVPRVSVRGVLWRRCRRCPDRRRRLYRAGARAVSMSCGTPIPRA